MSYNAPRARRSVSQGSLRGTSPSSAGAEISRTSQLGQGRRREAAHPCAALHARLADFERQLSDFETSGRELAIEVGRSRDALQQRIGRASRALETQRHTVYEAGRSYQVLNAHYHRLPVATPVGASEDRVCRFCFSSGGKLLAPCHCKGSQRWVHSSCLLRWRAGRSREASRRCEVCRSSYLFAVPKIHPGQLLVPAEVFDGRSPLCAPALFLRFGDGDAEIVEFGPVLPSDTKDTTRILGGPSGGDWALALLPTLPICDLPQSVKVNGELRRALCPPGEERPPSVLLSGPAPAVSQLCSEATGARQVLQFSGHLCWPRRRLEQLIEHGTVGVASVTLHELFGFFSGGGAGLKQCALLERADFADRKAGADYAAFNAFR